MIPDFVGFEGGELFEKLLLGAGDLVGHGDLNSYQEVS